MFQNLLRKTTPIESFLIVVIIILLIVFSVFLIRNVQLAHKSGVFKSYTPISELLLKNKEMNRTSIKDTEYIDIWMTFQYINFIFDIPENHLRDTLHITDPRYPNLTIGRYIKNGKLDRMTVIDEIKRIVREYMSLHPSA